MKRFSTWLSARHPDILAELGRAIDAYNEKMGEQTSSARGPARAGFEDVTRRIANVWQTALHSYKSEVVDLTYARLDSHGARRALTVQWDRLLHSNADLKFRNLTEMAAKVDAFSAQFKQTLGGAPMWEDFPMTSPEASPEAGFIAEIGGGFSDSYKKDRPKCLAYSGETELEPASRNEFELGMSGTAWIGLLVIAARTGLSKNVVFLLPASHMEKHITAPHDHIAQGISEPLPQFGGAGHQGGVVRLLGERRMNLGSCNRCLASGARLDPKEAAGYGCIMGFAMVKAYDAIGHQWAFTSSTCNVSATGQWSNPATGINELISDGDNQLPTDWAVAIWRVTKDLPARFTTVPQVTHRGRIAAPLAAALPPPPISLRGPTKQASSKLRLPGRP